MIPVASFMSRMSRCMQSQSTHTIACMKFLANAAPLRFSDPLSKDRVNCNHFPHKRCRHPCPYLTSPGAGPNQSSLRADSGPNAEARPVWQKAPRRPLLIKSCFKSVVGGCGGGGGVVWERVARRSMTLHRKPSLTGDGAALPEASSI